MKTLDEVIKFVSERKENFSVNGCFDCHYCGDDCINGCVVEDTLHYLKNYRDTKEWLELEKKNYAEAVKNCERTESKYTKLVLDMNRNDPLTWDKLEMGKPVWIEWASEDEEVRNLVIDISNNGGGSIDIVVAMASLILS